MQKKKAVAILGIGTNLGDKIKNLSNAIARIKDCHLEIISSSKIYQTPPWGFQSDDDFYNMAIKIETRLNPFQLLVEMKAIELQLGRSEKKSGKYASRLIDIDIIDYNQEVYSFPDLTVPHEHLEARVFVLFPLKDIHPNYQHPKTGVKIQELIDKLKGETIAVVNI